MNESVSSTPTLEEQLARRWAGTRLAHTALQIAKDAVQFQTVNRLANKAIDGTITEAGESDGEVMGDIQVIAGDLIVSQTSPPVQHPSGAATVPPVATPDSPVVTVAKKARTAVKLAIAAGLLAAGGGLGAGLPWLLGAFNKAETPPTISGPGVVDTDTFSELDIGGGGR